MGAENSLMPSPGTAKRDPIPNFCAIVGLAGPLGNISDKGDSRRSRAGRFATNGLPVRGDPLTASFWKSPGPPRRNFHRGRSSFLISGARPKAVKRAAQQQGIDPGLKEMGPRPRGQLGPVFRSQYGDGCRTATGTATCHNKFSPLGHAQWFFFLSTGPLIFFLKPARIANRGVKGRANRPNFPQTPGFLDRGTPSVPWSFTFSYISGWATKSRLARDVSCCTAINGEVEWVGRSFYCQRVRRRKASQVSPKIKKSNQQPRALRPS